MGRPAVSPFVDDQYKRFLGDQYDERVRRERAATDAGGADPNSVFSRMQTDAATGPQGFNRQWVPFFEALRGDKVNLGSLGLPTHTETSGGPSDAMASLQAKDPTDARLDDLWAQSSLRDRPVPSTWRSSPAVASLKRGR